MQHLDNLWKAVNIVGNVRDMAIESKTYRWNIEPPITFYLHVEHADILIQRWESPIIDMKVKLQAGFGWRVATDQDEAGVYVVAKRKPFIGSMGRAKLTVTLPQNMYLTLKLEHCQLSLDNLNTTINIPPLSDEALSLNGDS